MSPLRDWPIKRKLTAILLLISGLVLVLTSAAFVTYQVVTFRGTIQSHLATRSRILAANSTAALAFANEADATEILAALKYDPHMVAAALYNQDGRSEEHTSELQSRLHLVCRLLLEKKNYIPSSRNSSRP